MQVEEETLDTPEVELETVEEAPEVDWKAEAEKAKELANNYKIRAEKAERKAKEAPATTEAPANLSTADIIALSKANIDAEDVDEVLEYAKYKGISVAEALRSTVIKATLAEKDEHRKSALAVSTGTGRRADTQISDERLLADARKGIMPSSEEDIARLTRLRFSKK